MSYDLIRSALELRLHDLHPQISTVWENVAFTPTQSIYQRAFLLPSDTSNPEYGGSLKRETGILQVSICTPLGSGSAEAMARAKLIREWFYRGMSLTKGSVTILILKTPSIAPALYEETAYVLPVSVTYQADVF